ncbi:MAG: energy transducer TonB [Deltaproteobacteria bacterium]|nr:energy transducer TonB [Kofleriaceae bacterium]
MFEGFEQVKDDQARKRWFASTGTSIIVVVVFGAGLVLLARQQVAKAHVEKEIDVTFRAQAEPELEKKPPPPPPPVEEKLPDPIHELDTEYVSARPLSSNLPPAYPESARKKGTEEVVKLKVRISATGEVVEVTLLSGDEPFASVAIAAVKAWRYAPATDQGQRVASTRVVSIPFRLQSR